MCGAEPAETQLQLASEAATNTTVWASGDTANDARSNGSHVAGGLNSSRTSLSTGVLRIAHAPKPRATKASTTSAAIQATVLEAASCRHATDPSDHPHRAPNAHRRYRGIDVHGPFQGSA